MMKKTGEAEIIEARIVSQTEIAENIFRIRLDFPYGHGSEDPYLQGSPGQFVNLYLRDRSMLLPRPISICRREDNVLELVYRVAGKGTKELSGYQAGEFLRISTPMGNGYDIDAVFSALDRAGSGQKAIVLAAGGLGVPPMIELAKTIRRKLSDCSEPEAGGDTGACNIKLVAVLGFRGETFLTEELADFCDEIHIASEEGACGYRGNVLDMIETLKIGADYYLSCGPRPMLRALAGYCRKVGLPLQISLEERMGCGYGACVGCTCKTSDVEDGFVKVRQKKVCKDGPVFFGNEVIWDD